ncbi:MAG: hypothetical protein IJG17_05555 [Eubacterium sp.]|nr:hypothetical protein [Eubacterium sp.]
MKNTKLIIAGLTAAMVMSMCSVVPVFAKDKAKADNLFVSEDGIVSIELPDESWKEVQDPNQWIVLSDGENEITLRHFSNGAGLPGIVTADDHYKKTLTSALSTKNEVFIATGLVANEDETDEINESLQSIKILKYDTKTAVKKEEPSLTPAPTPAPAPAQETKKEEAEKETAPSGPVETYLVYSEGSGRPVNITGSDGVFYDGSGNRFYANGGGVFSDEDGCTYTTWMNESAPDEEVIGLVSDGSGRPVTIMENEDGSYSDQDGVTYYENENGTFTDEYDATYQVSGVNG